MNNTAETPRMTDSRISPAVPKPPTITRRIGNTTYRVRVHFSKTSKETMNDKILRMIKNGAGGKAAEL